MSGANREILVRQPRSGLGDASRFSYFAFKELSAPFIPTLSDACFTPVSRRYGRRRLGGGDGGVDVPHLIVCSGGAECQFKVWGLAKSGWRLAGSGSCTLHVQICQPEYDKSLIGKPRADLLLAEFFLNLADTALRHGLFQIFWIKGWPHASRG